LQRGKTYATAEARLTGDGGKLFIHDVDVRDSENVAARWLERAVW